MAHLADDQILEAVAHRPWPLPNDPWVGRQTWHNLLFAHWPISRDLLRERVPSFLEIDTFDGQAWLGVTPFKVTDSTARGIPAIPWLSSYNELNVRTYVVYDGVPGVHFFSLDADSTIAVAGATALYRLPYYLAQMNVEDEGNEINFSSRRVGADGVEFRARYAPVGPAFEPKAQTLEHWLTERYCLYTVDSANRGYRVEIHHLPWQLEPADAAITVNTMPKTAALHVPAMAPLLHLCRRQDTLIWLPHELS